MATYAEIVTRIRQYTVDNEAPLISTAAPLIDNIIARAEQRIANDLHVIAMEDIVRVMLEPGTFWVPRPVGWLGSRHLMLQPQPSGTAILVAWRSQSWMAAIYPVISFSGIPRYYGNADEQFMRIAPATDRAYLAEHAYEKSITGLSATQPTTWISRHCDELLFKASLREAEVFHGDSPGKRDLYEADYQGELARVRRTVARQSSDVLHVNRGEQ